MSERPSLRLDPLWEKDGDCLGYVQHLHGIQT